MYTRPYLLTQVDDIITAILDIKRHKEKVWVCWCDWGEEERRTGEEDRRRRGGEIHVAREVGVTVRGRGREGDDESQSVLI